MYHRENEQICKETAERLKKYAIRTDLINGNISFARDIGKRLTPQCNALYLLRHAETYGTKFNKFMNNFSKNSKLTQQGIKTIVDNTKQIEKLDFDYIFYSSIPRVRETFDIVIRQLKKKPYYLEIPWMLGIDNSGWEEKNIDELVGEDKEDFYQREILHNIFAKSSGGCCWGEVLCRCIDLVEFINKDYKGKKILLISQGSIFIGLQIVLQMKEPWENYNPETFFSLKTIDESNYGKLQLIFKE